MWDHNRVWGRTRKDIQMNWLIVLTGGGSLNQSNIQRQAAVKISVGGWGEGGGLVVDPHGATDWLQMPIHILLNQEVQQAVDELFE